MVRRYGKDHDNGEGGLKGIDRDRGDARAWRVRRRRIGWSGPRAGPASGSARAHTATRTDAYPRATIDAHPHPAARHAQHRRISGLGRADVDARADCL